MQETRPSVHCSVDWSETSTLPAQSTTRLEQVGLQASTQIKSNKTTMACCAQVVSPPAIHERTNRRGVRFYFFLHIHYQNKLVMNDSQEANTQTHTHKVNQASTQGKVHTHTRENRPIHKGKQTQNKQINTFVRCWPLSEREVRVLRRYIERTRYTTNNAL
jgi:hypothetical protein